EAVLISNGHLRVQLDGLRVIVKCLVVLLAAEMDITAVIVSGKEQRVKEDGLLVQAESLIVVHFMKRIAEVETGGGAARTNRAGRPQKPDRLSRLIVLQQIDPQEQVRPEITRVPTLQI